MRRPLAIIPAKTRLSNWISVIACLALDGYIALLGDLSEMAKSANLAITVCLLAGCASVEPQVVQVPVATSCLPTQIPQIPPTKSDPELASMSDADLVLTIAAERLDLLVYSKQADALLKSCQ